MADKKLYGAYSVDERKTRAPMRLLGASHSVKRLRRVFGSYPIFQVKETKRHTTRNHQSGEIVETTYVEYVHFGKEIAA